MGSIKNLRRSSFAGPVSSRFGSQLTTWLGALWQQLNRPIEFELELQPSQRRPRQEQASPIHWISEGQLALGPMPTSPLQSTLEEEGIQVVVSLCAEKECKLPQSIRQRFRCVRVPLPDSRSDRPLELSELAEAVELVQWHIQQRRSVYVHCLAAVERSPLICIAYLCRYQKLDLLDALSWVSHVHPKTQPNRQHLQILRQYLATPMLEASRPRKRSKEKRWEKHQKTDFL